MKRAHIANGRNKAYAYCTGRWTLNGNPNPYVSVAPYKPAPRTYAAGYSDDEWNDADRAECGYGPLAKAAS